MRHIFVFYLVGIVGALLTSAPLSCAAMISAGLLALLLMAIGRLRPLAALILGVLWASLHIQAYLEQRDSLPPGGLVTQVSGAVDSFAYVEQGRQSFVMQLAASPGTWLPLASPPAVADLGCYACTRSGPR